MNIEKYKGVTIEGSHFPDKPIVNNAKISFNKEILEEYIPAIEKMNVSKGLKLLLIIMTDHEGYYKGTRSYRTNNPGNIGNTDSGANVRLASLEIGIQRQIDYFTKIINGSSKTYPMNKLVTIKPFYSAEIAKNIKVYQMSPYLPGYRFIFTGQLDQFIKIYSTGARAGNSYLSEIISFFKNHGITVTSETTLNDINRIV
tara:strand:+ start:2473 stop:3072 length:600 start_codon:yes stop_codon:yes gene_type:complete